MMTAIHAQLNKLKLKLAPLVSELQVKWRQLQPREQKLLMLLAGFLAISMVFLLITSLMDYKRKVSEEVNGLNHYSVFAKQSVAAYKQVAGLEANTFNTPELSQIKADVTQIMQVKEPDILWQDGQMTLHIANAPFSQVMLLLEQFRRSYAIFPNQLSITRQSRAGFVSVSATFWVKQ